LRDFPAKFRNPAACVIDDCGHYIISDYDAHTVGVYDEVTGALIRVINPGNLRSPLGLALDRAGHLIVSNRGNHKICIYDYNTGDLLQQISQYGTIGSNGLNVPCGITLAPNDDILYICDLSNNRIQVLHFWDQNCDNINPDTPLLFEQHQIYPVQKTTQSNLVSSWWKQ